MAHQIPIWRLAGVEHSPARECHNFLHAVIERQIVPQLIRAHADQISTGSALAMPYFKPHAAIVAEFAQLCHQDDEQAAWDMLDRLVQEHPNMTEILLNLITPAARHLGAMWDQDRLSFTQVTVGLLRMQNMTHHHGFLNRRPPQPSGPKLRVMVAAAPGSQHLLGLAMVSEFFINDGWDTYVEMATTEKKLLDAIHGDWFDVVGLSVGFVEQLDTLATLIQALRTHARNPHMGVLLGGPAFVQAPDAENPYGADAICLDPLQAIRIARQMTGR